ncbi:MAG: YggS family pyridoxal phosphate-dependent enzyme [Clostridiales bacterium]|nr:YggS family pyridoxal phosphate-dependent enzyme [Clostridiales bacterium]
MNVNRENLEEIRQNIKTAAKKAGRRPEDIILLGVTKTVDCERIQQLVDLGVKELGENRVQELMSKINVIKGDVNWHLIGSLQTNKVKYIIGRVKLIHSVDSVHLAEEISRRSLKAGLVTDILLEVNAAREESKHGFDPSELYEVLEKLREFRGIRVKGLMTVAPYDENPENNRVYFKKMRELFVDIKAKNCDNIDMTFLSMGMTNDYTVAIEEGADIVRIGTGIFGARNYN